MSAFLLDTHVWIWYANGNAELHSSIRKKITTALYENKAHLAAISLWEISMLDKKKRIILEMPCLEWINQFLELTRIRVLPITPAIATESCHLPGELQDDPADRLIIATARVERLTLMTRDSRILAYGRHKYITAIKA